MTDYETAVDRLANHAGLPTRRGAARDEDSLQYQLYRARAGRSRPRLEMVEDVVRCLLVLNRHVNGPDPDHRDGPRRPMPDGVAYSVACIIDDCLGCYREGASGQWLPPDAGEELLTGTHRIVRCWAQVLAGDVSDPSSGFDAR